MKKLISIFIISVLILSMSVTVFATDGQATPDTADADYQIKVDASQYFSNGEDEPEDFIITHYGALSDGRLVLNVDNNGGHPAVIWEYNLGNYYYAYDAVDCAYIYSNNTFESLVDAYENGSLSENDLAELAACSEAYLKNPQNEKYFYFIKTSEPEETTESAVVTEPATTEEITVTEGNSTVEESSADSKVISTADTAAPTSGGAVQTGQGTIAVLLIIALLAFAGFTVFKFRFNK